MLARVFRRLLAIVAIGALWLVTEGSADSPPGTGERSPGGVRTAPATAERASGERGRSGRGAILRLRTSRYGKVIFEKRSGLVAYLFTGDRKGKSRCEADCARAWPPIRSRGRPRAGAGLKPRHVGTIKRDDGSRMVAYKGRPLYFYEHDPPGEILCHDVFQFGGDWFVVKKSGKPA